jgi:hypothetical protein
MNGHSRRTFLLAILYGLLVRRSASAQDRIYVELDELPPLPDVYKSLSDEPSMNQEFGDVITNLGTGTPSNDEVDIANEIIAAAPTNVTPMNVAGFFLDVARGKYGDTWRPYTRAWPKEAHANPLILSFFNRIGSKPLGDTTAWCAAFVNWCLLQSWGDSPPPGSTPPTRSASSGSFRSWGRRSLMYSPASNKLFGGFEPSVGDLVIFQEIRLDGVPDASHGHVAFFLDMDEDRIKVLGGNQFEGHPVIHAINVKWLTKKGQPQLHSIRSDHLLSG